MFWDELGPPVETGAVTADPYFHDLSERWSAALAHAGRRFPTRPIERARHLLIDGASGQGRGGTRRDADGGSRE